MNQQKIEVLENITVVNWHLLEESFTGVELLVVSLLVDELWNSQLSALESLRLVVDADVPLLPLFHFEELLHHTLDVVQLLLRSLFDFTEESSHGCWVASDRVWNTINQAELRRDLSIVALVPDDEHWLSLVGDLEIVSLVEVLGHGDFLAVSKIEKGVARTKVKLDVLNDVGSLDAVVGDDTLACELLPDSVLEVWYTSVLVSSEAVLNDLIVQLVDLAENSLG